MKKCPTYELFRLENDLDKIVEYDNEDSYLSDWKESEQKEVMKAEEEQCGLNSNTMLTSWSRKTEARDMLPKDI